MGQPVLHMTTAPAMFLMAMGLSEERVESAIRLSWGARPIDTNPFIRLLSTVGKQQ